MEFGRTMDDYWDVEHAQLVQSCSQAGYSHIHVTHALLEQKAIL
jgi:hypothetical protein